MLLYLKIRHSNDIKMSKRDALSCSCFMYSDMEEKVLTQLAIFYYFSGSILLSVNNWKQLTAVILFSGYSL